MTDASRSRKAIRSARRRERYHAREVLWDHSSLGRVRSCGLRAQGSQLDERTGRQVTREPLIALRLSETAEGRRAGWSGVQSCGSTWSCPVCSEKIQAQRNAEVASALALARHRGWVVAFLTFTVKHRRYQSLAQVWSAVSHAWRSTTSGSRQAWEDDRDEFGIRGYLRLVEVTHGSNGWHVHVHALVFLDPFGRMVDDRRKFVGPLGAPAAPASFTGGRIGPQTREEAGRLDAWLYGPLTEDQTRRLEPARPRVLARSVQRYATRGVFNLYADQDEAREHGRRVPLDPRLYRRDVEALGDSMGARWIAALTGTSFRPGREHGVDARLVTSDQDVAVYFAKHQYDVKTVESAAFDVTSSFAKTARRGNRTPFGILADFVRTGDIEDLALWREWEQNSKGKRQLLWSNGLRADLGLVDEVDDQAIADADDQGDALVHLAPQSFRAIMLGGHGAAVLHAAELSRHDLELTLLELGVPFTWAKRPDEAALTLARFLASEHLIT